MILTGCTTNPFTGEEEVSKTGKGALIGAAGGAVIGAITGGKKSALIGAGVGALAGGAVGYYMDRQEDKLRQQLQGTGVNVTREGDNIHLNMPGNITFATNSADINGSFYPVLNSVTLVIKEYDKTLIQVAGYTDSTGSFEYNQALSERRAESVGDYLFAREITPARMQTFGMGESDPIASNHTPKGRQRNRRVELILVPLT
jgi:outer membrane protein OmpA-like peptidoglycan-associated protein